MTDLRAYIYCLRICKSFARRSSDIPVSSVHARRLSMWDLYAKVKREVFGKRNETTRRQSRRPALQSVSFVVIHLTVVASDFFRLLRLARNLPRSPPRPFPHFSIPPEILTMMLTCAMRHSAYSASLDSQTRSA